MSDTKETEPLKEEDTIPLKKMCQHWYLVGMNPGVCPITDDPEWMCLCCEDCKASCGEDE